jgi:hypothetical protein
MIYYKKIEIDYYDEVIADTLNYLRNQRPEIYNRTINATYYILDINEFKKYCPKLDLAFQRYDIVCNFVVAFVMKKNSDTPLHVDNYAGGNARINLPILNTEGSYTRFYTGGEFTKVINPVTKVPALVIKAFNGLKMVDRVEITQATVIRVNEPHDIALNPNTNHRITLTLGFDRDPIFLLED